MNIVINESYFNDHVVATDKEIMDEIHLRILSESTVHTLTELKSKYRYILEMNFEKLKYSKKLWEMLSRFNKFTYFISNVIRRNLYMVKEFYEPIYLLYPLDYERTDEIRKVQKVLFANTQDDIDNKVFWYVGNAVDAESGETKQVERYNTDHNMTVSIAFNASFRNQHDVKYFLLKLWKGIENGIKYGFNGYLNTGKYITRAVLSSFIVRNNRTHDICYLNYEDYGYLKNNRNEYCESFYKWYKFLTEKSLYDEEKNEKSARKKKMTFNLKQSILNLYNKKKIQDFDEFKLYNYLNVVDDSILRIKDDESKTLIIELHRDCDVSEYDKTPLMIKNKVKKAIGYDFMIKVGHKRYESPHIIDYKIDIDNSEDAVILNDFISLFDVNKEYLRLVLVLYIGNDETCDIVELSKNCKEIFIKFWDNDSKTNSHIEYFDKSEGVIKNVTLNHHEYGSKNYKKFKINSDEK